MITTVFLAILLSMNGSVFIHHINFGTPDTGPTSQDYQNIYKAVDIHTEGNARIMAADPFWGSLLSERRMIQSPNRTTSLDSIASYMSKTKPDYIIFKSDERKQVG